ncbi:HTH-type transcriptional regulator [Dinoroseobacter shibae DFL 12 = DSM 16493]|jgi:GntR family transcriptional regulator/MocR family aminotransferase|uniref:HTH-type transcriptional regulator n=1 Tax=Dinoroseobacter shibae (strain DSM 16493 / NCIMB 14021 / DFL 12) TaxID=398580 RepID=A8LPS8_DINSH|nr:PLP-dependent aminotransferase family protein [Dinoroseobacter shibae]ABV93782.1 HTH-type transcriptional regulator [Dinoroseobacter shibae DFL 12 = DSM 16493]URF45234.1 PLP-dependent aminotransferase family protein [Dinoroseobacter shibae]URF49539.1 PLP-dependent aminotransferase family protein [Dinoroseobacter shibae]
MDIRPESLIFDQDGEGTRQHRIKRQVIDGILSGRFKPGDKMPSSRGLARQLGVSRITVTIAYTDLVADDYLVARGRSGYFVSDSAPSAPSLVQACQNGESIVDWTRLMSHREPPPEEIARPFDWHSFPYPFIYGQTDPQLFDHRNWRLCALEALGLREFESLTADHYERDDPKLVEYIQRNILPRRGIAARPNQILITMGAQNALWLCAQLLLTQRRKAVLENPGYPSLRQILGATRCHTQSVDVDADGLAPETLPDALDVLFTTVSHQCPTNATMPLARRKALLSLAAERGFVVVEDEYEFELAFGRTATPSLKSFDTHGTVIYVGSFSKSLFPGLRLGFMVAPHPFIAEARRLRGTVLRHPPGLIQRTTANFLSRGHFDAQINRMRKAYEVRRRAMETAIAETGLQVASQPANGGSSLWMRAPDGVDTDLLARRLRSKGVVIEPGAAFFDPTRPQRNFYRLAYSSIEVARIPQGIRLIAAALADLD